MIYRAKNLHRFCYPLRSEYDYESNQSGKIRQYIELIPLDGYNQSPKYSRNYLKEAGVTFENYKTNNPNKFWVKPN